MLEPLQMFADCADGLPALQGSWPGFPAHEPVPDEPVLLELLWPVSVDPLPAEAVVAPEPLADDVPEPVVAVPVLPVDVPVEVPVEVPVLPLDVPPLDPDESPLLVPEPVPSVVGVGLPEDPSPLVGVGPVSPEEGLTVGGGPVLPQPGGAVGVGLLVDGDPSAGPGPEGFPAPPSAASPEAGP